jgi:hypothetical protein
MTPNPGGEPTFERIECELAKTGILDRISVSPDETKLCFDYQPGTKNDFLGRTLYVADFDVTSRTITNARPFANAERKQVWFDYPRWTRGGNAIVSQARSPRGRDRQCPHHIPPGADNHREEAMLRLPMDATIMGFLPHLHLRGKACKYEVTDSSLATRSARLCPITQMPLALSSIVSTRVLPSKNPAGSWANSKDAAIRSRVTA